MQNIKPHLSATYGCRQGNCHVITTRYVEFRIQNTACEGNRSLDQSPMNKQHHLSERTYLLLSAASCKLQIAIGNGAKYRDAVGTEPLNTCVEPRSHSTAPWQVQIPFARGFCRYKMYLMFHSSTTKPERVSRGFVRISGRCVRIFFTQFSKN